MLGILRIGAAFVPLNGSYASDVQLRQMVGQVPFPAIWQVVPVVQEILVTETIFS